ncbi:hypothetical protein ANCDUO_19235 [Ancylostoma duodenale]|uniref:Secreted protein n=1 Tax=Ancylostoma duodenale TaxID=51022 RepID=A0A0C2C323_9BILA|nr:hypothetical protein ANCDUO_19235 [Ancylostoma duodenale]
MMLIIAIVIVLSFASGDDSEEEERLDFTRYSDHFARKMMLTISAAAYSNNPEKCLTHILGRVSRYSKPWATPTTVSRRSFGTLGMFSKIF